MCNLYTVRKSAAEVAAHFGVADPVLSNAGEEVCLSTHGLVAREREGARVMQSRTGFAEAEGEKGSKTRTWFSVRNEPISAKAGLWRQSAEWGPVYAGVMTGCNEAIRPVHDRMPVLLHRDEHYRWLRGNFDDLVALQERCFPDDLIAMVRTDESWVKRRAVA